MPAHATNDYILRMAALLFQTLDPALNLYVEYSNEVRGSRGWGQGGM